MAQYILGIKFCQSQRLRRRCQLKIFVPQALNEVSGDKCHQIKSENMQEDIIEGGILSGEYGLQGARRRPRLSFYGQPKPNDKGV